MQRYVRRGHLIGVGVFLVLMGAVFAALVAVTLLTADEFYVDATPADLMGGGTAPAPDAGDVVWLRGLRDTENPVELVSGRVLYPTLAEPRVLVDCDGGGCDGTLVGAVSEWNRSEDSPRGWTPEPGLSYRIVTIGDPGVQARRWATGFAVLGLLSLLAGIVIIGFSVRKMGNSSRN